MAATERKLAESFSEFTLDVYKNIARKSDGNLFMSPSSVMVVMTMVHAGARGNTESQMKRTLKLERLEEKGIHATIENFVREMKKESANFTLTTANKLYPTIGSTILEEYLRVMVKHFLADTKPLDYVSNPEECRLEINKWVEDETKNKITNLLPRGAITPATTLVVVNAIYFKGDWADKFDAINTSKRPFHTTATKTVTVDMMFKEFKKTKCDQIDELDCSVLILPYKGKELSMLILLPNKVDGLPALEKRLTAANLIEFSSTIFPTDVDVSLPKFNLESTFQLSDCLAELGMADLFSDKADLSGMSESGLHVSDVIHKAYVDVNEEGTEAAAATAAVICFKSMPIKHTFKADHPFLFVIQDNRSGVPLFIGRFVAPPGQ